LVKIMPFYCPKCGNKVDEDAAFCPKCGAIIKIEQAAGVGTHPARHRNEKDEKAEKHEKREHTFIGWLIGGLAVILVGIMYFVQRYIVYEEHRHMANAFFLIFIGAIIIVGAFYGAMLASRRHPKP